MLSSINSPALRGLNALVNAAVVLLALLAVLIAANWDRMPPGGIDAFLAMRISIKNLLLTAIFLICGGTVFHIFGITKASPRASFWPDVLKVVKACTVASIFALLFPLTSNSGAFNVRIGLYFLPTAILACLCGRLIARALTERLARTIDGRRDLIIVGSGPRAMNLYWRIRNSKQEHFRFLGFVDSPAGHAVPAEIRREIIGALEELEGILMRQPVDAVIIALPAKSCYDQIQTAIATCERAGVEAQYLSDIFEVSYARPTFEPDTDASVVSLKVVQDDARLFVKRGIDILGSVAGLIVFGPLMLLIAASIKLTSPGPAIFTQQRYGLRKRRFRVYKFRTMVPHAEQLQAALESQNESHGPAFKIRNDPRVTPLGRFLRKASLDELPQFFNVLSGEMSLVGPRPLPERDVSRFDDACLMRRFSVKPGLTCLWQINGRSNMDFDRWIELDLMYIDTWSLGLDFSILARTVPAVLKGHGAA